MTGLEFKRLLDSSHLSPQAKFLLNHHREVMVEQGRQLNMCVSIVEALAGTVAKFVNLHESTQDKVREMINAGKESGVDVYSEGIDDDPERKH